MTQKEVEQVFGKAESVGITLAGRESWNYTFFLRDHCRICECHVDFDETGEVAGYGSGHSPESWPKLATVGITIGKEYWRCVEPKPGRKYQKPAYDDTIREIIVIW